MKTYVVFTKKRLLWCVTIMLMPAAIAFAQTTYIAVSVNQPDLLAVNLGPNLTTPLNVPVALNANLTGGTPQFTYLWVPATFLNNPASANPTCTPTTGGSTQYVCTVTDAQGCTATDTIIVTSSGIAIDEFAQQTGVAIYPNPANEVLFLHRQHNIAPYSVQLFDARGRLVYTLNWQAETVLELSVRQLPAGMYVLHLEQDNMIFKQKITILK